MGGIGALELIVLVTIPLVFIGGFAIFCIAGQSGNRDNGPD